MAAYAGKTIGLSFMIHTDEQDPSAFLIDDVSLKGCGLPAPSATSTAHYTQTPEASKSATSTASPSPTATAAATQPGRTITPGATTATPPTTGTPPPLAFTVYLPVCHRGLAGTGARAEDD